MYCSTSLDRTLASCPKSEWGFPSGSVVKNLPVNAEDVGSISEFGKSPRGRNGNPTQCSCLGNPMDQGSLARNSPWRHRVGHDLVTETTSHALIVTINPNQSIWEENVISQKLHFKYTIYPFYHTFTKKYHSSKINISHSIPLIGNINLCL